ncbi:hypothetical protein Tco_1172577 [Tanacetum coccineum]
MAGVDIKTLTMEQYLALARGNQAPAMVKPEIGGNIYFKIKSQFMRELKEDTFSENKNEDAHDHVDRILNIPFKLWLTTPKIGMTVHLVVRVEVAMILRDLLKFRLPTLRGPHLDKECPFDEEVKYGEYGRPFPNNNQNNERFGMPIILGRPLLATAHAKVDIFRKSILLEVGNEKIVFKMRSSFTTTTFEYVRAIKTEIHTEEDDLMNIDSNLFLYDTNSCRFNHLLSIDHDVVTYDIEV